MSPLPVIFPAALMRLFQEELLVRVDFFVHEGRELVLDLLELVVRDRLRDGGEAAPAACRVRQPRGGEQEESHASYAAFTAAGGPAVLVFALQLVAGEMLDIYACADVPLVQRGAVLACAFCESLAPCILALAAIDAEIPGGGALRASNKPREV